VSADPLRVALGERGYDIHIGPGEIDRAGERLAGRIGAAFVVTDEHLARSGHLERLEASLRLAGIRAPSIVLPPGETSKSFAVLERLLDELIAAGADRGATVVALGGGVIGDLAGFAAAVLLRGVAHVQVPTTLLAQVDAAIGGKTGINLAAGKNLVGAFHQPLAVVCDVATLATLPPRIRTEGLGEVVKYGLIADPHVLDLLDDDPTVTAPGLARQLVERSVRVKAEVVAADEREGGVRAHLNLGHTYGHAVETLTGYSEVLHGEGVAIGTVLALRLGARLGRTPDDVVARGERLLTAAGLPTRGPSLDREQVWQVMARDKKATRDGVRWVVLDDLARPAVVPVDRADVDAVLDDLARS
jgi:3-dehydroquinate synthase